MSYKYREEAAVHMNATFAVLDVQKKKARMQWLQSVFLMQMDRGMQIMSAKCDTQNPSLTNGP